MRSRHAPGHIRETFLEAVCAYHDGLFGGESPPTVTLEINYEPHPISVAKACGLVWNCTDILPRHVVTILRDDCELPLRRHTYAAAAQAILAEIRTRNGGAA